MRLKIYRENGTFLFMRCPFSKTLLDIVPTAQIVLTIKNYCKVDVFEDDHLIATFYK